MPHDQAPLWPVRCDTLAEACSRDKVRHFMCHGFVQEAIRLCCRHAQIEAQLGLPPWMRPGLSRTLATEIEAACRGGDDSTVPYAQGNRLIEQCRDATFDLIDEGSVLTGPGRNHGVVVQSLSNWR